MENSFVEQITKRANKNFLIMSVLLEHHTPYKQPMDVIRLLHVRLNKWTNVRCTMHRAHAQYIYYAHLWKFMANLWSKNVTLTIYHYMQWIQVAEHRLRAIFCLDIKVGEFELHIRTSTKKVDKQTDKWIDKVYTKTVTWTACFCSVGTNGALCWKPCFDRNLQQCTILLHRFDTLIPSLV